MKKNTKTNKQIKFKPFIATTGGKGYWSDVENRRVKITKIMPDTVWSGYITFSAYINNWNNREDGLVYTDPRWLREFQNGLQKLGIPKSIAKSIDYTQQGMQGHNYVSLETSKNEFAELMGWSFMPEPY